MSYRNHTSYAKLGTSCTPQTISCTSNHKFLTLLEPKYRDIDIYYDNYNYIPTYAKTYEELNSKVNINGIYNPLMRTYAGKNNEYIPDIVDIVYTFPNQYNPLTGKPKKKKTKRELLVDATGCKNC